jgi:hypothetical protein
MIFLKIFLNKKNDRTLRKKSMMSIIKIRMEYMTVGSDDSVECHIQALVIL